jgi:hypothetical protein
MVEEPVPDYLLKPADRLTWTEPLAQKALINCLDPYKNQVFPNVMLGGGEMDLAVLTKAGYLTEVEIKLTPRDWRDDQYKEKWLPKYAAARQVVKYFCYAVPVELMNAMPEEINPNAGIIALFWEYSIRGRGDPQRWKVWGQWARQPTPFKGATKVTPDVRQQLMLSLYHRYWRQLGRLTVHDDRLLPLPEPTAECS